MIRNSLRLIAALFFLTSLNTMAAKKCHLMFESANPSIGEFVLNNHRRLRTESKRSLAKKIKDHVKSDLIPELLETLEMIGGINEDQLFIYAQSSIELMRSKPTPILNEDTIWSHRHALYDIVSGFNNVEILLKNKNVDMQRDFNFKNETEFSKAFNSTINFMLSPTEKFLETLEWPAILDMFIGFGDQYSKLEVKLISDFLSKNVHDYDYEFHRNSDPLSDDPYYILASTLLNDLKGRISVIKNYQLFAQVMQSSGTIDKIKKFTNGFELPKKLEESSLKTNMLDSGEEPTFIDLKEGRQVNQLYNPFSKYIGQAIKNIPLKEVMQSARDKNPELQVLSNIDITNLKLYHRTSDIEAAHKIFSDGAVVSLGRKSAFGGSAVWGEGKYLGFSNLLYHYGVYRIQYEVNPEAIIGKDLDIFIGSKDGLIAVLKNKKALKENSTEFDPQAPPMTHETSINHLKWLSDHSLSISTHDKIQYVENILKNARTNKNWGPLALWFLKRIDRDIFNDPKIGLKISTLNQEQSQDPINWPLKHHPESMLEAVKKTLIVNYENMISELSSNLLIQNQVHSSRIDLLHFSWFPVADNILESTPRIISTAMMYATFKNLAAPDFILKEHKSRIEKQLSELQKRLSQLQYDKQHIETQQRFRRALRGHIEELKDAIDEQNGDIDILKPLLKEFRNLNAKLFLNDMLKDL